MATPFISRDDLGDHLGQTLTSSAKALQAVDFACDVVRDLTEQTFNEVVDDIEVFDGTGTDALVLPQLPVTDVYEVIEDDVILVQGTDYEINSNGVLKRLPTVAEAGWSTYAVRHYWAVGRQNITVTYTHGYADADIPRSIRGVALSIAARMFNQAGGAVYESLGQYSVRYSTGAVDVTPTEKLILQKYRGGHPFPANVAAS